MISTSARSGVGFAIEEGGRSMDVLRASAQRSSIANRRPGPGGVGPEGTEHRSGSLCGTRFRCVLGGFLFVRRPVLGLRILAPLLNG